MFNFKKFKFLGIGILEIVVMMSIVFLIAVISANIIRNNYKTQIHAQRVSNLLDLKKLVESSIHCNNTILQAQTDGIDCFTTTNLTRIAIKNPQNNEFISRINTTQIGPIRVRAFCRQSNFNNNLTDIYVYYYDTREKVLNQKTGMKWRDLFNGIPVTQCQKIAQAAGGGGNADCQMITPVINQSVTVTTTVDKNGNVTHNIPTINLTVNLTNQSNTKEVKFTFDELDPTNTEGTGLKENVTITCSDINTLNNGDITCKKGTQDVTCTKDGTDITCTHSPLISTQYKANITYLDDNIKNCDNTPIINVTREWNKDLNGGGTQWQILAFLKSMIQVPLPPTNEGVVPRYDALTPAAICSLVGHKYNATFEIVDKTDCVEIGKTETRTGWSSPDNNYFYFSNYPTFSPFKFFSIIKGENPGGKCPTNNPTCSCHVNPKNTWIAQLQCKPIGKIILDSTDPDFKTNGFITINTTQDSSGNYSWQEPSISIKIDLFDEIAKNYNKLTIKYKTLKLDGTKNPNSNNFEDNLQEITHEYTINPSNSSITFTHTPFMTTVYTIILEDTMHSPANPTLRGYESVRVKREWINMPYNTASSSNFVYPSSSGVNFIKGLDDLLEAMVKINLPAVMPPSPYDSRRAIKNDSSTAQKICELITKGNMDSYDCKFENPAGTFSNSWIDNKDRIYYKWNNFKSTFDSEVSSNTGDSGSSIICTSSFTWISTLICNPPQQLSCSPPQKLKCSDINCTTLKCVN